MSASALNLFIQNQREYLSSTAMWGIAKLCRMKASTNIPFWNLLVGEAEQFDLPFDDVILANFGYELSHFGCTVRCYWTGKKWVHQRLLDWPIEGLGECAVKCRIGNSVLSYSWPGFVGILQGVNSHLTISINYAQSAGVHLGGTPISMITRNVTGCKSFKEAVSYLTNCQPTCRAYITICGKREQDACTVEIMPGRKKNKVEYQEDGFLVQANHSVHHPELDYDEEVNEWSHFRHNEAIECESLFESEAVFEDTILAVEMSPGSIVKKSLVA
jgi:hypothetical protein